MAPIVVFDTSVLLSAIRWGGKPFHCLELARAGTIEGVICREILEEPTEKLQTKLDFMPDQIADILADLLNELMIVTISGKLHVVAADPKDDMVIECGVVAGADYIVSGDRRHLLLWLTSRVFALSVLPLCSLQSSIHSTNKFIACQRIAFRSQ